MKHDNKQNMATPIKKTTPKKKPGPKKATTPKKMVLPPPEERMTMEEITKMDAPIDSDPNPSTSIDKRKGSKYVDFHTAREFIRAEMIPSRVKYDEWWNRHMPKDIPKYPYRVYKEWITWNDFLGTNNIFGNTKVQDWLPYEEARQIVHTLNIESYAKWLAYAKEGKLPERIPVRPDLTYSSWRTWASWLGKNAIESLIAKKEVLAKENRIFYVIHEPGTPENVITFGIDRDGIHSFKAKWEANPFNIIRVFWYNPDEDQYIKDVINQLSSPYLGDEQQRIVKNYWEILYYIEQKLMRVDLTRVSAAEKVVSKQSKHHVADNQPEVDQYDVDDLGIALF